MHWSMESVETIVEGWCRYAGSYLPIPGDWKPQDWLYEQRRAAEASTQAKMDEAARRLRAEGVGAVRDEASAYLAQASGPFVIPPARPVDPARAPMLGDTWADRVARLAQLRTDTDARDDDELVALAEAHADLGNAVVGALVPRFGWLDHDRPPSSLATLGDRLGASLPCVRDEACREVRTLVAGARAGKTAVELGLGALDHPDRWARFAEDCALAALGRSSSEGPRLAEEAPSPRVLRALHEAAARAEDRAALDRAIARVQGAIRTS
jgi:hypothetical protein